MTESPAAAADLLALEHQVCFALSVASRGVVSAYRPVLEPLRLTHPQYLVMLALWQDSPTSLKELAGRLHMEPATLSPLVRRLEALGYVERGRNPDDGRGLALSLTEEGRDLREQAVQVPLEMMRRLRLSEEEVADLQRVTAMLISRVGSDPA